jgi:hypothetical protein
MPVYPIKWETFIDIPSGYTTVPSLTLLIIEKSLDVATLSWTRSSAIPLRVC